MTTETETTLQEDIISAMEAVETLEPSNQARDEKGKFVPKDAKDDDEPVAEAPKKETVDEAPPAKKEPVKDTVQEPLGGDPDKLLVQDKAPAGWTPKAREEWAKIPEPVRQEILRREEDSAKGVRQLQEQMAPYTQFAQTLEPYIKEAFDNKTDPGQYIGNVMQAERRLRSGTADQRFSALVEIAEGYGIPLRKLINDAMGQEVIPDPHLNQQHNSIPPEIQRELEESRKFREEMKNSANTQGNEALVKEIEEFSKDKEFFDDVREDMGALFEMGRAKTLQEAYDMACKINPEVSQLLADRAAKTSQLSSKQKAAAQMKGTSSNSAEAVAEDFDDEDDLATTVRKAAAQAGGRV